MRLAIFKNLIEEFTPAVWSHIKNIQIDIDFFIQTFIGGLSNWISDSDKFSLMVFDNFIMEDSILKSWQRMFTIALSILALNQKDILIQSKQTFVSYI